jgi:hypothetical protein
MVQIFALMLGAVLPQKLELRLVLMQARQAEELLKCPGILGVCHEGLDSMARFVSERSLEWADV